MLCPGAAPIGNLTLALAAMLAQQACATMGRSTVPLIAPAIIAALDVDPALVGVYLSIASCAGIVTTLGCGGFILRYGAVRMTQVGMLSLAAGLAASASGVLAAFAPGAAATGLGSAVSTPSSSHLLARYAPPRLAPLVFSIKQTGVPVGLMVAGLLAPALVGAIGWQGALLALAAICAGAAIALQPLRQRFDTDRNPAQPLSPGDIGRTLAGVLGDRELRVLAFACFSFVGLQSLFTGFLVLYLVRGLHYGLAEAGYVFSIATMVAIPARIFWGWLAGRFVSPRRLLAVLGTTMAAASGCVAALDPAWGAVGATAAATLFSATAVSWHGVLLAEVARLAPPGRVGATTGGVLGFGDAASFLMPLAFSAVLAATGSYRAGYLIGALPALAVGVLLAFGRRHPAAARGL